MIEVNYNDYKRILEENMRLIPENYKLKKEVERLKSIINELEKYFEQEGFWHSLDKIKELKGEDKE